MVCGTLAEEALMSHKRFRVGQDIYSTDCETDSLSGDQSDICGQSSVYAATLVFVGDIF